MTLNPQKRVFSDFLFAIFGCGAHFKSELRQNGLGSRRFAQTSIKKGYFFKEWLSAISLSSIKIVADR